jgi:hypothetical protein
MKEKIEELIEDYNRRIKTVNNAMKELESEGWEGCPDNPTYARLSTKLSCYRTFVAELQKTLKIEE